MKISIFYNMEKHMTHGLTRTYIRMRKMVKLGLFFKSWRKSRDIYAEAPRV